jgi:mannose/fructose/N-acetylgalactosamine-specific phosphotransferase system component IID
MIFTDKESSKNYEANFAVNGEPLSARVYITIVLFSAKFYKLENGVSKGSHLITSRAQALYKRIEAITSIKKILD